MGAVEQPSVHHIHNRLGTRLGLTHFSSGKPVESRDSDEAMLVNDDVSQPVVLLTHGTFSNHRSCSGLAKYLAKAGCECWVLDFQGHGHSSCPVTHPSFESMCLDDTEAAILFLQKRYPTQKIHFVGHSGGGLAILMYLARNPLMQESIGHVVTLASQATHAGVLKRNRWAIRLASLITRLLGFAPGRWLGIGPEHEFGRVMSQWYRWSLEGRWLGADGFDYEAALPKLDQPLLCLAAEADTFIAPQDGCRHVFDLYGSGVKEYQVCGISTGFLENYTHARIISSSSAAKDIWPRIYNWLVTGQNQKDIL